VGGWGGGGGVSMAVPADKNVEAGELGAFLLRVHILDWRFAASGFRGDGKWSR